MPRFPLRLERRWLLTGVGVCLGLLLVGNRGMRSMLSSWWSLRSLRAELKAVEREEGVFKDRIAAAKGDDRALERAARAELGYQRAGEIEYRFPPPVKR
ncbi:MAG: septum formation initiator family protein [Elusimicrobia bacterium]|nr:septum formation initiator family protein [Elusimicrobiota bacterium]